jgi:malate dehydrogenase
MDVAVIGAAGACGRQLCMQLLERRIVPITNRLQLVGHHGGASENELWGLRADMQDAFSEWAPSMQVVMDPEEIDADIVVMMAGATVSAAPGATLDRAGLARTNAGIFRTYAEVLGRSDRQPIVVVQSNPVELAVEIFAEHLDPKRVLGAGARSDSLRFAREIAADLGVTSRAVFAFVMGQHGDYMVPLWSRVDVRGLPRDQVVEYIERTRGGHPLSELPVRIREGKTAMLALVNDGRIREAFDFVQAMPADLRAAVKPFFTHFTAGHTTEAMTARSAADIVEAFVNGVVMGVPAQVQLSGAWADSYGLTGVLGVPVLLGRREWALILPMTLAVDERDAMLAAATSIAEVARLAG